MAQPNGWSGEIDGMLRGLTGGFLIGIPLLYTMETWQVGERISPAHALVFLACAYGLNLMLVTFAGFHRAEPGSVRPLGDALEATALAILAAAISLTLLHQIEQGTPLHAVIGRIAVNTLPISIGVAIANHLLRRRDTRTGDDEGGSEDATRPSPRGSVLMDLGAAFGGALFFTVSIAPTDEVPVLATEIPFSTLPLLILFSLTITYGIVFVVGYGGQDARLQAVGPFQRPITETVVAYVVSLLTAATLLILFEQITAETDWALAYAQIVILGLPAAIGGAAGRLAA